MSKSDMVYIAVCLSIILLLATLAKPSDRYSDDETGVAAHRDKD